MYYLFVFDFVFDFVQFLLLSFVEINFVCYFLWFSLPLHLSRSFIFQFSLPTIRPSQKLELSKLNPVYQIRLAMDHFILISIRRCVWKKISRIFFFFKRFYSKIVKQRFIYSMKCWLYFIIIIINTVKVQTDTQINENKK